MTKIFLLLLITCSLKSLAAPISYLVGEGNKNYLNYWIINYIKEEQFEIKEKELLKLKSYHTFGSKLKDHYLENFQFKYTLQSNKVLKSVLLREEIINESKRIDQFPKWANVVNRLPKELIYELHQFNKDKKKCIKIKQNSHFIDSLPFKLYQIASDHVYKYKLSLRTFSYCEDGVYSIYYP